MADGFRSVKLTRNGQEQTVRIPAEFTLPGDEATIRQEGQRLIIEPLTRKRTLVELLDTLEPIEENFDFGEDLPAEDFEL